MSDHIGLYYPHFTFPNDAWVKLAALYWDKLGRILPPDYIPSDSDTVQRLQGELDFTKDFIPAGMDTQRVGAMFIDLLKNYRHELFSHYGTHSILPGSLLSRNHSLFCVYSDIKICVMLSRLLQSYGLAVDIPDHQDRIKYGYTVIGMHPKLAYVYLEALADQIAGSWKMHPVTDSVRDHVVVGGYTLERLAQALLSEDLSSFLGRTDAPMENEIAHQMAAIALQSVLPKDIASVPVEKIIQVRQKHRAELTAFQEHIHEFITTLDSIQQIDDPRALQAHLEAAYDREIKPQVDDLRKYLKSLAIDTVTGILNIKVVLPPLLASAGAALHLAPVPPEVAGTVAIACSVFPVLQKKRSEIYGTIHKSPAAYLLYTEEGLTPANVVTKVRQTTRHLLLGV